MKTSNPAVPTHKTRTARRPLRIAVPAAALLSALMLALVSCGGGGGDVNSAGASPSQFPPLSSRQVAVTSTMVTPASGTAAVKATVLATGLSNPWSLAFLPDGRMLVTERSGTMQTVSTTGGTTTLTEVPGVPPVLASGQGGLLDVQVDPSFSAGTPWVYFSYSEPGTGAEAGLAGTAVARGKLVEGRLREVSVIFRQTPKVGGSGHFGSRLVFGRDGTLFVTLGERQQDSHNAPTAEHAQNLSKHLGKVVRINKDGSRASGNPVWGVAGALPEIWSAGHRNPQGAALHPTTGELWMSEHGPMGGDEVNISRAGLNYGWPLRSYGCPYGSSPPFDACRINGGVHAPTFTEPLTYWTPPSIAPSGLAFYTANKLPEWQGNLLLGALSGSAVWRLTLSGNTIVSRQEMFKNEFGRIRDVRQGPDGWLYLLSDESNGKLIRIER